MIKYIDKKIQIKLLEDTHIGSGAGGNTNIDATTQKDKNGFPMIPATLFKGLMRDYAQKFSIMKDNEIKELFGKSASAPHTDNLKSKLLLTSFYIIDKENLSKEDCFIIWQSTAMENDRKLALENSLRSFEYIKAGLSFEATISFPKKFDKKIEEILQRIDAIGHSKNRGSGQVQIKLLLIKNSNNTFAIKSNRIRIFLKNHSSVSLPSRLVSDDIIPTETFLRGQRIKGAFANYLVERDFSKKEIETLFEKGIIFTNGYFAGDARSYDKIESVIPMPASLQKQKYSQPHKEIPKDLPHWAVKNEKQYFNLLNQEDRESKKNQKVSRPKDSDFLVTYKDGTHKHVKTEIVTKMRNQIKLHQNKNPELFSEEQIVENSLFIFDLIFKNREQRKAFKERYENILNGTDFLRMGRGGQPFKVLQIEAIDKVKKRTNKKGKINFKAYKVTKNKENEFCFLFLKSDLIVRDKFLNFHTNIDNTTLSDLGLENIEIIDNGFVEAIRVSGFNAASKTMKNPKIAIKRGSIVKIQIKENMEIPKFLGEDNEIGFGEIEILDQPHKFKQETKTEDRKKENETRNFFSDDIETAKNIFSSLSKSHLQWIRTEINKYRMSDKNWKTQNLIDKIKEKSLKLGGKDFEETVNQLEEAQKSNLNNEILMLGLRKAIINKKGDKNE